MQLINSFKHHTETFHDYSDAELKEISVLLCSWYDKNRRKLPWRGDQPPYTTYNVAVEEITKKSPTKTKQKTLTSFFSVQPKETKEKKQESAPNASEGDFDVTGVDLNITPYHVWVSEIMLQQTRVDTVIPKYLLWMKTFPTIQDLSFASEDKVQSLWSGLGYYRRARMLHEGAQYVMSHFHGQLPNNVKDLLTIKGIGDYTAGAISSIAFNNPDPLVDGNVLRVFSRHRLIFASPSSTTFNTYTWNIAKRIVQFNNPSTLNQALMELGAIVCVPKSPKCDLCPISKSCYSYQFATCSKNCNMNEEDIEDCSLCSSVPEQFDLDLIPLTNKKVKVTDEYLFALVFVDPSNKKYYLAKKSEKGVLQGKLKPFSYSLSSPIDKNQGKSLVYDHLKTLLNEEEQSFLSSNSIQYVTEITHQFSHIHHFITIYKYEIDPSHLHLPNYDWYSYDEIYEHGLTTWLKKILLEVQKKEPTLYESKRRKLNHSSSLELKYEDE